MKRAMLIAAMLTWCTILGAQPREVDKKALFPGRTAGSTTTSNGTGMGGSWHSVYLFGRSLVNVPFPDYNSMEEGRVTVNITVDQKGKVTAAAFRSIESTTQNSALVDAAMKAALQARFNVDENAPISQKGTITYNFRVQPGEGTGMRGSGNLSGRSLVGALPRPDYNSMEEGRVTVNITVDQKGKVTAAAFCSIESTTQNSALVDAAMKAALQARFNVDENAPISQPGTITYNFKSQ